MLSFKMCRSGWGKEGVQWVIYSQTFLTVFGQWQVTAGLRIDLGRHGEEKHVHEEWGSNPKSALHYNVQVPGLPHVPLSTCTCQWTGNCSRWEVSSFSAQQHLWFLTHPEDCWIPIFISFSCYFFRPNSTNLSRVSLLEVQRRALLSTLQICFLTDSLKKNDILK